MADIQNSFNNKYFNIAYHNTLASGKKDIGQEEKTNNVSMQEKHKFVGAGSWRTQQIKDAGLELPSEYFIGVYTDYYRFNIDKVSQDFPGKIIMSLEDLKKAIESKKNSEKQGSVGTGSWRTQQIKDAGLKLPSKYFIGVYTDYFRFDPDTISQEFPNKSIQTLADLKAAIDELGTDDDNSSPTDSGTIGGLSSVDNDNNSASWTEELQEEVENLFSEIIYSQDYDRLEELAKYPGVKVTIGDCGNVYEVSIQYPNGDTYDLNPSKNGKIEGFLKTDLGKALLITNDNPADQIRTVAEIVESLNDSGKYTIEELKDKYQLTDDDIAAFFEENDGTYVVSMEAMERYFGKNDQEYTISDLFSAIKYDGMKKDFVKEYDFSEAEMFTFFTGSGLGNGSFKLNLEAVKAQFPDREIRTISQLKQAIEETGLSLLLPSMPYSGNNLKENYGLTDIEIDMFFDRYDSGYKMNENILNEFFGIKANAIHSPADLKKAMSEIELDDNQKQMVLDYVYDSCIKCNSIWGFDKLKSEITEEQRLSLYNNIEYKINNVSGKYPSGTLSEMINSVQTVITSDVNRYNLNDFRAKIKSGDFDNILTYDTALDSGYLDELKGMLKRWYKDCFDMTDEYLDAVMDYASRNIHLLSESEILAITENYRIELKESQHMLTDEEIEELVRQKISCLQNKDLSEEEIQAEADKYREELINKNNSGIRYTDEDIDRFVQSKFEQLCAENRNYFAKFDSLIQEFVTSYGKWFDGYYPQIVRWDSGNTKLNENGSIYIRKVSYAVTGLTSKDLYSWIIRNADSSDPVTRFQAQMFTQKFDEMGLSESEQKLFVDMFFKKIREKSGNDVVDEYSGEPRFTVDDLLAVRNGKGNSSPFDGIMQMLDEVAADIHHMDESTIQNATSIDTDELFRILGTGMVTPERLENCLSEMQLSNDPGVRKLAAIISDFCKKTITFGNGTTIKEDYAREEKLERIKWLIVLLNEQYGIDNPSLPVCSPGKTNVFLTPELISKLGDNVFDKTEEVINSKKLDNCIKANIDGIFDDIIQNSYGDGTNDCWLLAAVAAINSTNAGKELLRNSIKWNDDYTAIIVTYPSHPNDPVEIPVDLLLELDADLNKNSSLTNLGDNDYLALVIAYSLIFDENVSVGGNGMSNMGTIGEVVGRLLTGTMKYADSFFEDFLPPGTAIYQDHCSVLEIIGEGIGSILGTSDEEMDLDYGDVAIQLFHMLEAKKRGKTVAGTFVIMPSEQHTYSCYTTDGELWKKNMAGFAAHVMAITDITDNTVTFIDTDSLTGNRVEYTVTWKEFINIGIAQIAWAEW